jgi:hypothetical protein
MNIPPSGVVRNSGPHFDQAFDQPINGPPHFLSPDMVHYKDTVIGEEVHQIDAHQGGRWEVGRGSGWTAAARDLVKRIYDIPGPGLMLH